MHAEAYRYLTGESADEEDAIAGLQELIDTGQAWFMEGSVGRAAFRAIEDGLCVLGPVGHRDYWGNYVPSRTEVKRAIGSIEYAERMREQ